MCLHQVNKICYRSLNFMKFGLHILNIYEPRHAIMCLREIHYVMRYDVVKSDVIISHRA